jgi:uncharacterized protein
MQLIDGRPVFSATDLVGYLACEHLTALERSALDHPELRPERIDRELDLIRRHGERHEARYLGLLEAEGRRVVRIDKARDGEERLERLERQRAETVAAMEIGADVVYQATFFDGRWLGYADFLLKVQSPERPSVWGAWHYEVADTKLARHVKASAVLQICSYVDQLTAIQGPQPTNLRVVLGGGAHEEVVLRVDDYMAYYRAAKRRFEEAFGLPAGATYPEPVDHCEVCRWWQVCRDRRRADDHLSLVANISSRQRRALVDRGITTVVQLANAPLAFDPPLDGTSAASMDRVRRQARIQVEGRETGRMLHELMLPKDGAEIPPELGLAALPPPDPGDLFLDLEGDPFAFDDGLDYLFGVLDLSGAFTPIWSLDPDGSGDISLAGEKAAFERLIDLLVERLARHPAMHVYHYAAYEPTALKRLMGRHATREEEVDRLLRGGVLVDLYRVVRQGLIASVESYSIKRLEPLYGYERAVELKDATSSIVAFEEWLQLGDTDRPSSDILDEIARYNEDDVRSTLALRDWLEERRGELASLTGHEVPRPGPKEAQATAELTARLQRIEDLTQRLVDGFDPAEGTERSAGHARWLLGQLLSWHRREDKSFWWLYFHLLNDLTDEERVEASEPIGMLTYEGVVDTVKQSLVHRYRFPFQDHDIRVGGGIRDPATDGSPGEVVAIDDAHGTIDLKRGRTSTVPHPASVIPFQWFDPTGHVDALTGLAEWVIEHDIDGPGRHRAARDLLLGRPPRLREAGATLDAREGEDDLARARRLAVELDHGTLAIQGPPGSGKTYTGARMVVDLVAAGRRVGVTAMSHKVIANFLTAVAAAAREEGVRVRIGQRCSEDDTAEDPTITRLPDNGSALQQLVDGEVDLVGGTTWLWCRPEMAEAVDTLFVDEAGQMSLANVLAAAQAATSLVLLGDPLQLNQPLQGTHPPGADRSALGHVLGDEAVMPPTLGLFLEHTWRMHPRVTSFTSTAFYEGRLESQADRSRQAMVGPEPMRGAGVHLVPSDHTGADNESPEEAREVAQLVRAIVESGSSWVDHKGETRRIGYRDVLVVAPYNAQVGAILRALPEARVGTVDKFQGQEAPISIYSMTTSTPEDAPRGMSFLYSRNRLNVATSRAKCIAVVVAEPALLRVRARTPEQMRLANALCLFVEMAETA